MQRSTIAFEQQNPVLLAAFAFMLGDLAAFAGWRPAGWMFWSVILAGACASVLCWRLHRRAYAVALIAFIALGALDAQLEKSSHSGEASLAPFSNGLLYTITGNVSRAGMLRQVDDTRLQSVDVAVNTVDRYGDVRLVPSTLRMNIVEPDEQHLLRYGMQVRFDAQLHQAQIFQDPGVWDRRAWLREQGITALATVKGEQVQVLTENGGNAFGRLRDRVRASLITHLHELTSEHDHFWALSAEDVALLEAMMLGERTELERSDRLDFQRTGSFHLLVVSGMNIAIFAAVIFWALRKLPFGDTLASLLTASFAVCYAVLTDMGAPVTRAVIMAIIFLAARLFYRHGASLNALGTAALIVLLWKPSALLEASFQMTFLSVLAILVIASPLIESTSERYAKGLKQLETTAIDFALPREVVQFRIDLRMIIRRLQRLLPARLAHFLVVAPLRLALACVSLLLLSFIMQCVMALPTAIYFHRVTTTALAANSVAVPLMEALMPLVLITITAGYVSAALANIPAIGTALALHGISRSIGWLGNARFADLRVADPPLWSVCLCFASFVLAWISWQGRCAQWKWIATAALMTSALTLTIPQTPPKRDALEITAIDVGQGDSLLLLTPGGKSLLIDSGGPVGGMETSTTRSAFDFGENVVSPYLWSRHLSRLDSVAITHGHSDHAEGMPSIIRNFRPREVWVGLMPKTPLFEEISAAAREVGAHIIEKREGDQISFGEAEIQVLAPSREALAGKQAKNDDSLSLYVHYGKSAALLSGDAEHASEAAIAAHHPTAQLLKVDHHGSLTSTDPALLESVSPRYAVISVGAQNHFGHPRYEVLGRLQQAHVRTFRTDTTGAVTFDLFADGSTKVTAPSWEAR